MEGASVFFLFLIELSSSIIISSNLFLGSVNIH